MIIDMHTHCFPDSMAERAIETLTGRARIPAYTDGTAACLNRSMDTAGIDMSVICQIATTPKQTVTINNDRDRLSAEGRFYVLGTVHPDYPEWKEAADGLAQKKVRGIKMHPEYQDFYVNDRRMYPLYERVFSHGMFILFHAGYDAGYQNPDHCTPDRLAKVLDDFPGADIIAAHMGCYIHRAEVEKHLIGRDVYFDTSMSLPNMEKERAKDVILRHGYEKVLFGSDSPWDDQKRHVEYIRALGFDRDIEEAVLGGNARKLLRV